MVLVSTQNAFIYFRNFTRKKERKIGDKHLIKMMFLFSLEHAKNHNKKLFDSDFYLSKYGTNINGINIDPELETYFLSDIEIIILNEYLGILDYFITEVYIPDLLEFFNIHFDVRYSSYQLETKKMPDIILDYNIIKRNSEKINLNNIIKYLSLKYNKG